MTPLAWRALIGLLLVGLVVTLVTDTGSGRNLTLDERAVAIATLPCGTDLQATSSGFLVDDQLVVTVAHAIFETQDFAVRDSSGRWHRASVQQLDLARDLAVLRVDELRATPARFARAARDDRVQMIGGAASGTAAGSVTRRVNLRTNVVGGEDSSVRAGYELALDIDPGDSGAAVVDDEGRVVGIVFARSTRSPGVSWSTAADELETALGVGPVPTWQCELDTGHLDLEPPRPERLAG